MTAHEYIPDTFVEFKSLYIIYYLVYSNNE